MCDLDNPFWNFSVAVYGAPGVASECLALQSALDIDVNCLLFCAWLGAEHSVLMTDKNLHTIDMHVRGWHQSIVRPLRAVRQTLKGMSPPADAASGVLRTDVARAELFAEQIEQHLLFKSTATLREGSARTTPSEAVRGNVLKYLRLARAEGAAALPPVELLISASIAYAALG